MQTPIQALAEKVARRYRVEEQTQPKARTLTDVPGTYDAITAEWLTAVLCRDAPGAEVLAFRVTDRSDGSSNRARLHLTYNEIGRGAGLPATVFCKAVVTFKNRVLQAVCGGAKAESGFFAKARHRLDIAAPLPLHVAFDPETYAYIIVMKDMGATADFCTERSRIDRAQAEKIVATLARLHARFYESPELGTATLPFKTWPRTWRGMVDGNPGFAEACDLGFAAAASAIPPRLFARRAEIWPATERSVLRHDELPRMLTHCDVHLGNWYVAGNGDMGLTDWQAASVGHWSRDFIYATVTTLGVEDRRAWLEDLLRLYLERMVEYGGPRIAYDEAWFNLRQQLMTTLAFWTITLRPAPGMPPMQPESISYELVKRIAIAMDDMDALDAFA